MNWEFFPNPGNSIEGLNHPGIETFRGNWIQALAREMIQNSLDAADGTNEPVRVKFTLKRGIDFSQEELLNVFRQCYVAADNLEGNQASRFFRIGIGLLEHPSTIPCLIVEDSNTLGLAGKRWEFLLKGEGAGYKGNASSPLGSFGIGKNAAFAASTLRTVLYSTQFDRNGEIERRFQGKSVLISHNAPNGEPKRSVGYYGDANWSALSETRNSNSFIPSEFRKSENGTTVIITGFPALEDWYTKLTKGVVSNYFFAILDHKLIVDIYDNRGNVTEINRTSIEALFKHLVESDASDYDFVSSHALFKCISGKSNDTWIREFTTSGQLRHLGHCKIWISVGEGLPRNVAIIRRPGMIICDGVKLLPGLKSLPSHWSDFSAVVVCESEDGNKMLRDMEPPAHDSLEPDRLGDDAEKGRQALGELGRRIRQWLDHKMPRPQPDEIASVDELAEFFPSDESDAVAGNGEEEPNPFGQTVVGTPSERMPAVRSPMRPIQLPGYEFDDEGLDEGAESIGGSETRPAGRRRRGQRMTPARRSRIGNIRMRRIPGESNRILIAFTPEETCVASISMSVAAEDRSRLDDLAITSIQDIGGTDRDPNNLSLQEGERVDVAIQTNVPIPLDRALIVDATLAKESES